MKTTFIFPIIFFLLISASYEIDQQKQVPPAEHPSIPSEQLDLNTEKEGPYQKMPLQAGSGLHKYLITKLKDLQKNTLISYEKQAVNGFNHRFKYSGENITERVVVVFEDIQRKLKIVSDSHSTNQL